MLPGPVLFDHTRMQLVLDAVQRALLSPLEISIDLGWGLTYPALCLSSCVGYLVDLVQNACVATPFNFLLDVRCTVSE